MKRFAILLSLLLIAALFAGCAQKLSDKFDEDTVVSAAQDVVTLMNEGKYEDITAKTREDLREALSAEVIASAAEQVLAGAGDFSEFGKHSVAGQKDKSTGEDYAVIVLEAKYANKTHVYTLSFDADMSIIGFYVK